MMEKQTAVALFHSMHPRFFEREYIQKISEERWIFDEMVLPLDEFASERYDKEVDASITFGFYEGSHTELLKMVEQVDTDWVAYFGESDRVFCGYLKGKAVSFCLIEDMGIHNIDGRMCKIGGPGCVGTLPDYRDRGIGLMMVKKATQILKDEGYDYSYIHYTHIAKWYAKLGYETILQWTKTGIL